VVESAVINASPLIFLARSRHLDLLQAFASEIWIPGSVADEIRQRGPHDATAQAFADTDWFIVKPVSAIPATITEWRLGAGESAVLTLAAEHHLEAIVDDLAGRKCAASLNIPGAWYAGHRSRRQAAWRHPRGTSRHRGHDESRVVSFKEGVG